MKQKLIAVHVVSTIGTVIVDYEDEQEKTKTTKGRQK